MNSTNRSQLEFSNKLYEKFGKPLEQDHWGEFVAIAADGRFVLGSSAYETVVKAERELGAGTYLFKVGERVLGKWRWFSR